MLTTPVQPKPISGIFVQPSGIEQATKKPQTRLFSFFLIKLVPLTGIELVTFALRMRCSTD